MKKCLALLWLLLCLSSFAQTGRNDVFYEIFVRSFSDSDGDGTGDINGITQKLDYLAGLGITGLWLTPVHPSPSYHKYDVLDYKAIDPEYGTLDDYRILVNEAHKRGIKILLDLVVNHTSSGHPWFRAACSNDKRYRDYYVWSDTATVHGWYGNPKNPQQKYYAFFWQGMPDLNFDNPEVRKEIIEAGLFWVKETGIDGFRLDAAQHIYDAEDVAANNAWWSEFRTAMRAADPDIFLLGEVWNNDSVVAAYLASSLDACFNFDLSGAIIHAIKDTSATALTEKLIAIRQLYRSYNPHFTDATFISNHDQDRYASTFDGNEARVRQAFTMLMTLPGTPFVYYGEELGMTGRFPDEYRREPFPWGDNDRHTTSWEKPRYSSPSAVRPLEQQSADPASFYSFYRSMIALRRSNPALGEGELAKTTRIARLPGIISYERVHAKQRVLVIHNVGAGTEKLTLPPGKILFNQGTISGKALLLGPNGSCMIRLN